MGNNNRTVAMDEGMSESKLEEGEELERCVGFGGGGRGVVKGRRR